MIASDDTSSIDGPREDILDNVKFLSSALCKPVTVVLNKLTMNEINECRATMKRKKRKRIFPKKVLESRSSRRKKENTMDVANEKKCYKKTDINKEKSSMEESKTDASCGAGVKTRLQTKRKNTDAFGKKQNILPRKRQKHFSGTTRTRVDTANNVELSTKYTKKDYIKNILSNSKQLQVSLIKLENIKDDKHVNIWRSKLSQKKSAASSLTIQTAKDRQLSEALDSVALHLNSTYPSKKRQRADSSHTPLEENQTNSSQPPSPRKERKKLSKLRSKTRSSPRWSSKPVEDPQVDSKKLDNTEELSTKSPSVNSTEVMGTKDTSNLQLDETPLMSGNEEDDQDLIDEIISITNGVQPGEEGCTDLDAIESRNSTDNSPRCSPILGKSSARYLSKSRSNLQNTQSIADETNDEKSYNGTKHKSPSQKYSKTPPVSVEDDNEKSEDAEDLTTESRLHESPDRPLNRSTVRSKSRAEGRVSKKIWPARQCVTRSLSRIELISPSTNLSCSHSDKEAYARKKSALSPRSALKRTSNSAVTDTSNIAETRSSDKELSPSSSRVICAANDDTAVNRRAEHSSSPSPVSPTKDTLTTSSTEEARVSPSKSATRSPVRPPIQSSCSPRTLSFVSPKSPTKSSATETQTSNADNQLEPEKTTSDPEISTTTTNEVEDTPAAVGRQKESNLVLSEDEDSIQLIIDDDSTKEVSHAILNILALAKSNREASTSQDQDVPMQESTVELSRANTESNIDKTDEHQAGENVAGNKRATSVVSAQQSLIRDVLDKRQKSVTPLLSRQKTTSSILPMGRTKVEQLKSKSKLKNSSTSKCIICDSEFKTYELLQEHLRTHSRRQSPPTTGISPTDPCSDSMLDANKREQTFQDIGAAPSTCSKTASSVASSSKDDQEERSLSPDVIECTIETSEVASATSTQSHPAQKRLEKSKLSKAIKGKDRRLKCSNFSNTCTVCCKKFESKDELAAHIFVHTEDELQKAYEFACTAKHTNKQIESVRINLEESNLHDSVEGNTSSTTLATSHIEVQDLDTEDNAVSSSVLESMECEPEAIPVTQSRPDQEGKPEEAKGNLEKQKQSQQAIAFKTTSPSKEKKSESTGDEIEIITLEEPESQKDTIGNNESVKSVANENTERDSRVRITKPITVCECHRNDVTYGIYLRIEVSLLCHSCRTIYRSMECFEMHYRLPQHAECKKTRLHGRSPKLFCTNCGMIFSSIQDVRQHLEVHARYNARISTDFRCNLCKVIFIGVGSLFYIHWSNHIKNPLYIASKLSFPKNSVLAPKNKNKKATKGSSPDEYLYVAEHICDSCKEPFSTMTDLDKHSQNCKEKANKPIPIKPANHKNTRKVQPKIRLVCGICDEIFLDKIRFEKHAELNHKQHTEPQYICVALTTMSTVFSCSACTKMFSKLKDLETHWKTHDTKRERYMCKNCDKLHDSLESFVEHAKQYISDLSNSEVMCKVIYEESEFICKECNLGFDSKVTMNKHLEMHGVSLSWRSGRLTVQQQPTDLCVNESHEVDPLQVPEEQNGKTEENNQTKTAVTGKPLRQEEDRSSDKQIADKNELPSSCGQEEAEASEGELVIDYREMSENDRLQKTREKCTPSSTPDDLNSPITNKEATEDLEKECTFIAPTEEADKSINCTEKPPSHNSEPPRKGFLRVKTLAELTEDNIKGSHQCFICNKVLSSTDELASHILAAHSNVSAEQIAVDQSIGQGSLPNMSQPPKPKQQFTSSNARPRPIHSELPNTTETKSMFLINGRVIALNVQSNPAAIPQQQKPTWHTSEDRPVASNHTPKPVSGYHKNLPACPSTRPLSTATQRAPPRNPRLIAFRPKASTTNSPILKIPQPAAAGQPQQSCRTIYPQSQQRFIQNQPASSGNNLVLTSKQSISSTAIQHADSYSCNICPQFKATSIAEFILHELSAEHENRKKPPAPQTATVQNQSYSNYEQLVAVTTSDAQTGNINSANLIQNQQQNQQQQQQQQEGLQLYATEVYGEPVTYTPVASNQIINYTLPRNTFVNTGSIPQTAALNTQILIATPNTRTVYQPLVFNNSTGIAVMNNGVCYFCSASCANENVLRLHITVKHPYACTLCRKDFASPHELQAHKISHNLAWN